MTMSFAGRWTKLRIIRLLKDVRCWGVELHWSSVTRRKDELRGPPSPQFSRGSSANGNVPSTPPASTPMMSSSIARGIKRRSFTNSSSALRAVMHSSTAADCRRTTPACTPPPFAISAATPRPCAAKFNPRQLRQRRSWDKKSVVQCLKSCAEVRQNFRHGDSPQRPRPARRGCPPLRQLHRRPKLPASAGNNSAKNRDGNCALPGPARYSRYRGVAEVAEKNAEKKIIFWICSPRISPRPPLLRGCISTLPDQTRTAHPAPICLHYVSMVLFAIVCRHLLATSSWSEIGAPQVRDFKFARRWRIGITIFACLVSTTSCSTSSHPAARQESHLLPTPVFAWIYIGHPRVPSADNFVIFGIVWTRNRRKRRLSQTTPNLETDTRTRTYRNPRPISRRQSLTRGGHGAADHRRRCRGRAFAQLGTLDSAARRRTDPRPPRRRLMA